MNLQKQVFQTYKEHIQSHFEDNRAGGIAMRAALERSPLFFDGTLDKTLHIPKVFDAETVEHFRSIVAVTYRIFEKVIREYRSQTDYRTIFPFSPALEELMLLPMQCSSLLPIARFDLFYNEANGDFKFCEINADGTAAQLRDLEMGKALISNPAHQAVIRQWTLEPFELFDSWAKTFLALYEEYPKKKANPNVAIVDYLENATLRDFEEYARRFQAMGMNCEICDIRRLSYRDGVLWSPAGYPINAIYRRAVTADVMDHFAESADFLQAIREDAVFIAGGFQTQVVHSKWLFFALHHPRTRSFLTEEEKQFVADHVPRTIGFGPEHISLAEVQTNKDAWMLKPMDAYASKGIYAAGHQYKQADWNRLTEELYGQGLICQEYCQQYLTENIDFGWGDGAWHPYLNMPGLYVYNGQFAGVLMRMAQGNEIIVAHENERTVPVFLVTGKKEA